MTYSFFKLWFKSSKVGIYWITILSASPAWYVLVTHAHVYWYPVICNFYQQNSAPYFRSLINPMLNAVSLNQSVEGLYKDPSLMMTDI